MTHIFRTRIFIFTFCSCLLMGSAQAGPVDEKPNIIVILADDLGYADLGVQGSPDILSPRIDSIAENGVRFTDGYVTSSQCGPSRAGLLTGRYQNRFGFESNETAHVPGIPVTEPIIAERLRAAGYATGMMGKWGVANFHEGHPQQRGFDVTFWNHNGNRLFHDVPSKDDPGIMVRHGNGTKDVLTEYSTDAFTREAVKFIEANKDQPFFLYLPYVAPHLPREARPQDLARFAHVPDLRRRITLAMMANLDDNVGWILDTLRDHDLTENTLIFFISDNGGADVKHDLTNDNASFNHPLQGNKSTMFEGGIRIPFIMQWPAKLPKGAVYKKPAISLDIVATSLAVAGIENPAAPLPEGVNLIPYLTGKNNEAPHQALFWRYYFPSQQPKHHSWAIREGDWKLMQYKAWPSPKLFNLADDIGESRDLAEQHPGRVQRLKKLWDEWDAQNFQPDYAAATPTGD
jgi:arylsulfatase A-like enzyme